MLLMAGSLIAQSRLPYFLRGTWKMENQEVYEHWDKLNDRTMKGFTYKMADDLMVITEYLDLSRTGNEITYTATVLNQNQGKGITFYHTPSDSSFVFENPEHDFPKRIEYRKISDKEIFVTVSGSGDRGFSYTMNRVLQDVAQRDTTIANPNYDVRLAQELEADDYGMKSYIMVVLKTGPNSSTDTQFINQIFRGHLDNIRRLAEEGKLIVAGPLGKNDRNYRGIYIFDVSSVEEAEALLQTDPAIKEGLLATEIFNWYGSAALPMYLDYSDKIWKQKP